MANAINLIDGLDGLVGTTPAGLLAVSVVRDTWPVSQALPGCLHY